MISPAYCRKMAQYNRWQNDGLRTLVAGLSESDLHLDRKAFFGSISATMNHLLWGDIIWLHRMGAGDPPSVPVAEHTRITADKVAWDELRDATDTRITQWARSLTDDDLARDLTWRSALNQSDMVNPMADCAVHFFNHQTHHRGQIHAMMTAAGQAPDATDLLFMP